MINKIPLATMNVWIIITALAVLPHSFAQTNNNYKTYTVEQGDTLSTILQKENITPLYGKKGFVKKAKKLNKTSLKNENLIRPGQQLVLPVEETANHNTSQSNQSSSSSADQSNVEVSSSPNQFTSFTLQDFISNSSLGISLGLDYTMLESTAKVNNSKGKLVSEANIAWKIAWLKKLQNDYDVNVFAGGKKLNFKSEETGVPLYNQKSSTYFFGVGLDKKITERLNLGLDFSYGDFIFFKGIHGPKGLGIELNTIKLFALNPRIKYKVFTHDWFDTSVEVNGLYATSGDGNGYEVSSGNGFGAAVLLEKQLTQKDIFCRFDFKERNQKTSLIKLKEQSVGTICGLRWWL